MLNDVRSMTATEPILRLLIIEDSEDDALLLVHRFKQAGYRLEHERVETPEAMRRALCERTWDAVLSDHSMPGFSGLAALKLMQDLHLDLPFIIVSGVIEEETAVAAMRAGAHDYLGKNKLERLIPAVERELREARNRAERRSALVTIRESEHRFGVLVANIPGMVYQLAQDPSGRFKFLYVSGGCMALLGIAPDALLADPRSFVNRVLPEDRTTLESMLRGSAADSSTVNWDGRVRTGQGDVKWINVRSSPRRLGNGSVLWDGVVFNITQSKQTEQALRDSREQLADLSSHLAGVKEEERERIARDIHDELGGTLVALKFEVAMLGGRVPSELAQLRERVRGAEKLVDDAIATAGRVARELRPGILKDFGLAAAIECHAEDFAQRTGIPIRVLSADADLAPDGDTATAVFRVFQEALTNINKHAHASEVIVSLRGDAGDLVLEVIDNGDGISAADLAKPKSFGLRGMRERIRGLSGRIEIEPGMNGGTRLTVRAPLAPLDRPAGTAAGSNQSV